MKDTIVSTAVIRRLPKYYKILDKLKEKGIIGVSSQELSKMTGFTAAQIRQDFSHFGGLGQQGYGYYVETLHKRIMNILGLNNKYNVVISGAGSLGRAVANYEGFNKAGFKTLSLFDNNPKLIGMKYKNIVIRDVAELEKFIKGNNVEIGVITTPKENAQEIADIYSKSGIKGIWNFAPIDVKVAEEVVVENVHLNESLFILSYFLNNNELYNLGYDNDSSL